MKVVGLSIFIICTTLITAYADIDASIVKKYSGLTKHKDHAIQQKQSGRLVGGVHTTINKHPYQVALLINGTFRGSGIILDRQWVATVYSAVRQISPNDLTLRVGSSTYAKGRTVQVKEIKKHKNFSIKQLDYDLALLKLKKPLKFSRTIKKINIGTSQLKPGYTVVTSGWGQPSINKNNVNPYKELKSVIVSKESCKSSYTDESVTKSMVCAKSVKSGPCWDDFGNPLVSKGKAYGLFSWAAGCAYEKLPAVYTDLVFLRSDIIQMMKSKTKKEKSNSSHRIAKRDVDSIYPSINKDYQEEYHDDDAEEVQEQGFTETGEVEEMPNTFTEDEEAEKNYMGENDKLEAEINETTDIDEIPDVSEIYLMAMKIVVRPDDEDYIGEGCDPDLALALDEKVEDDEIEEENENNKQNIDY